MIPYEITEKLLSARPNHAATPASFNLATYTWEDDGGPLHSHPDFACLACHGMEEIISPISPNFGNPTNDFPHTRANSNLLSQEPDGLCDTCHFPGGIPLP